MAENVVGRAEVEIHAVQASSLEAETSAIAAKAAGQVEKEVAEAGKASGAVKNAEADVKSLSSVVSSRLSGALKSVGQDAGKFGQALEGGTADLQSMGASMGPVAAVAAVAAAAFVVAKTSVEAFVGQADEVRKFGLVSGASAEDASRLVVASQLLGVSTEALGRGMFTLSKNIETNGANLEANHIAIARTKDGQVDLTGTLFNVAGAYEHAATATDKNAVVTAAFGGRGRALIPILAAGKDGLRALADESDRLGLTFTKNGIDKAHEFEVSQRELGLAAKGLEADLGQLLVPALTKVTLATVDVIEKARDAGHWIADMADRAGGLARLAETAVPALGAAAGALHLLGIGHQSAADKAALHAVAEGEAAGATDDTGAAAGDTTESLKAYEETVKQSSAALKEHVDALAAEARAIDAVNNASLAAIDKGFAYREAELALTDATAAQTAAVKDAADATRQHGAASTEAKAANEALTKANLDLEEKYSSLAKAAADLAQQQAATNKQAFDGAAYNSVYKDKLLELAGTLAPGDPLRAGLAGMAADVLAIPTSHNTELTADPRAALTAINAVIARLNALPNNFQGDVPVSLPGTHVRAAGGPVGPGSFLVGEEGPERLDLDASGRGWVTPATQTRAQLHTGSKAAALPGVNVTVNVNGDVHDVRTLDLIEQRVNAGVDRGLAAVMSGMRTGTGTRG